MLLMKLYLFILFYFKFLCCCFSSSLYSLGAQSTYLSFFMFQVSGTVELLLLLLCLLLLPQIISNMYEYEWKNSSETRISVSCWSCAHIAQRLELVLIFVLSFSLRFYRLRWRWRCTVDARRHIDSVCNWGDDEIKKKWYPTNDKYEPVLTSQHK